MATQVVHCATAVASDVSIALLLLPLLLRLIRQQVTVKQIFCLTIPKASFFVAVYTHTHTRMCNIIICVALFACLYAWVPLLLLSVCLGIVRNCRRYFTVFSCKHFVIAFYVICLNFSKEVKSIGMKFEMKNIFCVQN